MTGGLVLLLSTATFGWLAPRWLWKAEARTANPAAVLGAWLLSLAGVLLTAVLALAIMINPEHRRCRRCSTW